MKLTVLTISLLLSLPTLAEENQQAAPPAASAPAAQASQQAEPAIPCPLPGEEPTNCPSPRKDSAATEAGLSHEAGGIIRPEAKPVLVSDNNPNNNAYNLGLGQPPSPLRPPAKPPVRDSK